MITQNNNISLPESPLSRRELLFSIAAAAAALSLPGCKDTPEGKRTFSPGFDPAFGELISRDPSIALREPMPEGFAQRVAEKIARKAERILDPSGERKKKWVDVVKREVQEEADEHGVGPQVKEVLSLTDEEVAKIGRQVATEIDKGSRILPIGHPLSKRVSAIVSPHREEAPGKTMSVKIYDDPAVNAFALPDGSIRLNRGLAELFSDDEIRAVFGHELGHVVGGHSVKRMKRALILQAGGDALLKEIFKAREQAGLDALAAGAIVMIAKAFLNAAYSRKNEFSADEFSFAWAMHHKYDLQAQVTIFEKLGGSRDAGFLSSHPASADRADRNRQRLKALDSD